MRESLVALAQLVTFMLLFLCVSYAGAAVLIFTLNTGMTVVVTLIGG